MRLWRPLLALCSVLWLAIAAPSLAQTGGLNALAQIDPAASGVTDRGQGIKVVLAVSQAVPYRVSFMDNPPRFVVDFHEVDFNGLAPESADKADHVKQLLWGPFLSGWSRMVAVLDIPQRLLSAEEIATDDGGAVITLTLAPTTPADFTARIKAAEAEPPPADWALPKAAIVDQPIRRQLGDRPLRVVLDPGHGGIDPGAEAGGTTEAKAMLGFALELAEVLRRAGMTVELTRVNDVFVPLETRISVARAAGADLFLSLHADALAEGEATGATVYKLAAKASDAASAQLAERHDRTDLLAGIDLTTSDDEVAGVLMDMARTETGPRADSLARALATAIQARNIRMHHHPIQEAAFSVLKSADIPSLLLEVGFLSSAKDRERLADPVWRASMADAILAALQAWAMTDAAEARLLRQ